MPHIVRPYSALPSRLGIVAIEVEMSIAGLPRPVGYVLEAAYEAARSFLHDLRVTGPGLYGSP